MEEANDYETGTIRMHKWHQSVWYHKFLIPALCLFPLFVRFCQCLSRYADTKQRWPNLANAAKYSLSMLVTCFGTVYPLYLMQARKSMVLQNVNVAVPGGDDDSTSTEEVSTPGVDLFQFFWMALFVGSSLYSFWWDLYVDWGLGQIQYHFLGPRLMFPHKIHYYGVILIDLILRFMWVLTLLPPQSGARFELPQYMTAVTMALELMRRTLWGFFRLEREHRSKASGHRRVNFVPLHFNTGHTHQYKEKKKKKGWSVLAEVATITVAVIAAGAASIIAAQKASNLAEHSVGAI